MRLAIVALVSLAACNAEPTPDHPSVDAPVQVDSPPNNTCLVKAEYGALGSVTGTASSPGMGTRAATIVLDPGPPGKDDLFIKFPATTTPGSHAITGNDANYATCSLCVTVIADIIPQQGPSKFYFASSGTVSFTSIDPPITGTVSNLQFTEIDISTGATIPGCTSSIASADFTAN